MENPPLAETVCDQQSPGKAPDGGWGWVIVIASFLVNLLVEGIDFTFGIFFPEFLKYFGESKGKTQLLHSIMSGTLLILGPFVSALVNKYGCQRVAASGALIASLAFFLSSFSPNLEVMIIFYSIAGGIGFGLLYLPSIVIISEYFDNRRALATGIAVCGAGAGTFMFAPLSEYLLETYLWRGTMWILSGFVLNGVIMSASFRPLITKFSCKVKKNDDDCDAGNKEHSKISDNSCQGMCSSIKDMFDFSLLKSPTMLLYGFSCLLIMLGFYIPSNFLPIWASDVNLSTDQATFLILLMGASNTATRVVIGYLTDKPWANSLIINNTALLIGGVTTCFVPFYTTYVTLAIYSVVIGSVMAVIFLLRTILMADLLGVHRLTSSFGLVGLSMGLSTFFGSPIAGALSDMSGNYNMTFYFGGITLGLGGLVCLPLRCISEWEKNKSADRNLHVVYENDREKY